MTKQLPISANELRAMAEAADGLRGQPLQVVWESTTDENGDIVQKLVLRAGNESGGITDVPAFQCYTKYDVVGRAQFESITVVPQPYAKMPPTGKPMPIGSLCYVCDAMFWSEAAVEKFVYPYYIHFNDPTNIKDLKEYYNHKSVYALIHLPSSINVALEQDHGVRLVSDILSRGQPQIMTITEFGTALENLAKSEDH
jgi:hypothetical protein